MSVVNVHGASFDVAGFSERGPRPENQDAFSIDGFADHGLISLADGMGGEKSGRLAAETALEALRGNAPIRSIDAARRAMRKADQLVLDRSREDPARFGGMGCALAMLSLTADGDALGWIAAHVGDVRILSRSPDGVLRLETRDHTPAFARWEAGEISLDQIPDSAGANRLQRAVGHGGDSDIVWLPAAPGWSWLVVSDGISKALRLDELSDAMSAASAEDGCETLRRRIDERGADDNYTAVLVRALDRSGAPAAVLPDPTVSRMATAPAGRSGGRLMGVIATIAAIAALVVSVLALSRVDDATARIEQAEIERLRTEVDSLRLLLGGIVDPTAPLAPEPTAPPATINPGTGTP